MKSNLKTLGFLLLLPSLVSLCANHARAAEFTYQGQLTASGNAANGNYDLTFALESAASGPSQLGNTLTNLASPVSNGLFQATLDFGPDAFDGSARWLEIGVRPVGGGAFTTLVPRQAITPTPHATFAITSGTILTNGTVPDTALSANVARRDGGNTFTGEQVFTNGSVRIQVGATTVLVNSDGSVSINSSTDIDFNTTGNLSFAGQNVRVTAANTFAVNAATTGITNSSTATFRGVTVNVTGDNNLNLKAGTTTAIQAGAMVSVNGGIITLN